MTIDYIDGEFRLKEKKNVVDSPNVDYLILSFKGSGDERKVSIKDKSEFELNIGDGGTLKFKHPGSEVTYEYNVATIKEHLEEEFNNIKELFDGVKQYCCILDFMRMIGGLFSKDSDDGGYKFADIKQSNENNRAYLELEYINMGQTHKIKYYITDGRGNLYEWIKKINDNKSDYNQFLKYYFTGNIENLVKEGATDIECIPDNDGFGGIIKFKDKNKADLLRNY